MKGQGRAEREVSGREKVSCKGRRRSRIEETIEMEEGRGLQYTLVMIHVRRGRGGGITVGQGVDQYEHMMNQ